MAHIYKYAILTAVPDPKRGERVNVGIAIFFDGDIDVRFSGVAKLTAISGGEWSSYVAEMRDRMKSVFVPHEDPDQFVSRYAVLEQWIQFSNVSWFSASTPEEYESRIDQIVAAFIRRPREEHDAKLRSTKINTEIAAVFRSAKVLAKNDETIEDHKIVRDYYISRDEELRADFVHKNGVFHVTATLDLRRPTVDLGHAALKAIVLDKAPESLPGGAMKYAVYAVEPGSQQFRPHIELLHDYSDSAFNWLVQDERMKYTRLIYSSLHAPFDLN
jgi:hypothetical protein